MIQKSDQPRTLQDSEENLISLAKDADDEAFFKISSNYDKMIKKIISCFDVPQSEFDDLYQEGLIGLYKAVMAYDSQYASFSTFSYICIKRSIITALKKYAKQSSQQNSISLDDENITEIELKLSNGYSPEELLINKESVVLLKQKLNNVLSDFERRVLSLYLLNMTYEDIASSLGKNRKSIDNAVIRVRDKLKMLLD